MRAESLKGVRGCVEQREGRPDDLSLQLPITAGGASRRGPILSSHEAREVPDGSIWEPISLPPH